ncbi:MAG: hypothetical protein N2039_08240 [Gemmataceae bacterium]|nr:hypothetical protein [Gemmataceae bacterium]
MIRLFLVLAAGFWGMAALGAEQSLDGLWQLVSVNPGVESIQAIIQVETKEGQPSAKVVFAPEQSEASISDFRVKGATVSFRFRQKLQAQPRPVETKVEFAGVIGSDPKVILGSSAPVGNDDRFRTRSKLVATEKQELTADELVTRRPLPEPMQQYQGLLTRMSQLTLQLRRETDEEKRKELQQQVAALAKERDEKVPQWLRETFTKHGDHLAAADAAMNLARATGVTKVTAEDAEQIVTTVRRHAEPYGPRFLVSNMVSLAEILINKPEFLPSALTAAQIAAEALTDEHPLAIQSRCLAAYQIALEKSERRSEAESVAAKLAVIEKKLDDEYLAKVPPFKPEALQGRKDKAANRVAVFELFTGAQCPPCVAADVAFDALRKTYPSQDVVMVQYHLHIPGPDPMTNPDTVARWNYYRGKFAEQIRGVPSSLFNGQPQAGGGGGMANSQAKFQQYRSIIDKLLENSSPIRIQLQANRLADDVSINVEVTGIEGDPSSESKRKLRLLLVEDEIRFAGSNGIRFHHHVVRAMPGGSEGLTLQGPSFRHSASVNVSELRKNLDEYLTTFAKEQRPFPQPGRPLDMRHLKVIALVQDDSTGEILQAVQCEVANP